MSNKKIPASIEAERGLIGSCLHREEAVALAMEKGTNKKSFHHAENKIIWEAIDYIAKNRSYAHINATTVVNQLKITGECDAVGGYKAIEKIIDDIIPTANALDSYLTIVEDKFLLREIINISRIAALDAQAEENDPHDILNGMMENVCGINQQEEIIDFHARHIERRNLAKQRGYVGYKSSQEQVNDMINSYLPPDNVVIAAKSSVGKTDFMLNEFMPHAIDGVPVGIFSTDMDEERLRERIASYLSEVNAFMFGTNKWKQTEAEKMDEAYEYLATLPIYICDKSDSNINDVISKGVLWNVRHKVKLFAVDFLQQLELTKDQARMQYRLVVGGNSGKIKALGKRFEMVTFCLSQITRYGEKTSDKTPPLPNKESLKEAGEIENNADIIHILGFDPNLPVEDFTFKNKIWNETCRIAKARNGPTGDVPLCFMPSTHRFMSRAAGEIMRDELDINKFIDKTQSNMQL